ncbi:restriction endonuclease subunit S [Chryseobacterium taklimakanense]|uniref:restriction endonuclease subunit S n=1 Tax=Chryseobacterium taklimakanense TaxID=536441 RepID=UPI000F5D9505|nr:restriction endonuclease subunit S [Chryseobacterium taklimakanense]AZI23035.1 restriction endonuclease subunit S [Chryseobacterium taklimakanense]
MRQNYKRLGDYIREVKLKNTDDSISELLGINIDKFFMPSVANIVGTDLSKYKVVKKNQFACNRMHVGRDARIPVAMSNRSEPFIVSPAYDVFEIIDENILIPEYLMMWFKRKEFDRNAWFYTDGDVRGGLRWNDFIDIELPIPSIEKQKELIAEYQTIENRIRLNNELCEKLEETAQTVYRHWFEDFEFPVIARSEAQQNYEAISKNQILQVAEPTAEYQNRSELVAEQSRWVAERSRSYKSSGGEMVYSEELGREIPKGWKVFKIDELVKSNNKNIRIGDALKFIKYLDTSNITNNKIDEIQTLHLQTDEIPSRAKRIVKEKDIIYSTVRPNLKHYGIIYSVPENFVVSTGFMTISVDEKKVSTEIIYQFLTSEKIVQYLHSKAENSVTTYPSIKPEDILNLEIALPIKNNLNLDVFEKIFKKIQQKTKQNQKLEELKSLMLGKMAVEG